MPQAAVHPAPQLQWKPLAYWPKHRQPAPELQGWLSDKGSLTARLIDKSEGEFAVTVLRQFTGRPTLGECKALGAKPSSLALIREVILKGHNQPWVFARSVLPLSSLTGKLRHLRKQTNRPLGAFLFSQPHLARSPIAVTPISRNHGYVPAELIDNQVLWGRRSVFYLAQKPILVSEVFLASFVASLR